MSQRTYTESITFATPPNGSTRLAVCPDCGSVVVNIPRHDRWHERTEKCCPSYPNGPQWGHEWSCPKCPD